MTDKKAAAGTNDFMTAYKAFIFDLPMAGTRWGLGLGGEKKATGDVWTGYDAIVRLSATAIENLYCMPWFGTFTSRSLEGWLRWRQVSNAFTHTVLTGLVQAAGLPTAAEVQALREELRAQTIDLPVTPKEHEAIAKLRTPRQKAPTLTQKNSVAISNGAAQSNQRAATPVRVNNTDTPTGKEDETMVSLLSEVSKYWMEGAVRTLDGLRRGFSDAYPFDEDPLPTTPYEVVYEGGKVRLRHYRAVGQPLSTPLLLVYSLIKRPYILDLLPGRSVVETLTKQGVNVYFIDWIPPSRNDSWRGFDAYLNADMANAVRVIQEREGVDQVSLLGYCFGGLLTTLYTALYPEQVKNLIDFTLSLDMSVQELPSQALMGKIPPATTDLITAVYGNCPAWLIKSGFDMMSPVHHALDKYVGLYRSKEQPGYAEMFELFERWMNSDVALAGQIFKEMTEEVTRKNLVVKNQFQVGGRTVNLKNITCPVLNVIGEYDDVVHPKSSLPLIDLVGSSDAHNLVFPTGHIGAAVSSGAQKKLWPQVGTWLRERDRQWGH